MILKEKEIFNKLGNEKLNEITELDNKVDNTKVKPTMKNLTNLIILLILLIK